MIDWEINIKSLTLQFIIINVFWIAVLPKRYQAEKKV